MSEDVAVLDGIEIRPEVAASFEGLTLEVDQASASFEADGALLGLLDQANVESLFSSDRALHSTTMPRSPISARSSPILPMP